MSIGIGIKSSCSGCGACSNICPKQCIKMVHDREGFCYPQIDAIECISCGLCEKVCPIINRKADEKNKKKEAYACINLNEKIRLESSSGGVFSILAERVIERGGKVYGATFTENKMVKHIGIGTVDELHRLRGSKYLQSNIGETYKTIKEELDRGKEILFSGTPCQNAGLRSFLGKEYEKLYCIDFICHGVPSPYVWKKYMEALREQSEESLNKELNPNFRSKDKGWIRFSVSIPYSHGKEYKKTFDKDLYMKTFLRNISLRPSCYKCKFKPSDDISDITIADFWGGDKVMPEMFDDKGMSLVVINSSKGEEIFNSIKKYLNYKKTDLEKAVAYNSSYFKPATLNAKREYFFDNIDRKDILELMQQLTRESLYIKIRRAIGRIHRKIIKCRKIK